MSYLNFSPLEVDTSFIFSDRSNQLKEMMRVHPLLLFKDASFKNDQEFLEFAQGLSCQVEEKILSWDFGPIMHMKLDPKASNYLFSDEKVPMHWDGAFYKEPRYLLFLCTQTHKEGGETLFCNTESLWIDLELETQEKLKKIVLTYKTDKKAHYGGEIKVPLVQKHPLKKNCSLLRFAEEVKTTKNPVSLKINTSQEESRSMTSFFENKLYERKYCYEHRWEKGDLIIADNFSLLHGRNPLGANLQRSFTRIQVL